MINDAVRGYFGFERLPFDRSIPVGALFASASHAEAVGRIAYGIDTIGNPRYQNVLNARRDTCAA